MPHVVLEYSSNLSEKKHLRNLFEEINFILSHNLPPPTDLASCKCRAIEHDVYYLGNGDAKNAFVHISLKIMAGRTDELKQEIGDQIINACRRYFEESLKNLHLQITLEIMEIEKYFKVTK